MSAPPTALPVIVHAIPNELKARRQWVAWKLPNKVPVNPDMGSHARVDTPSTWGTFEQAHARQRKDNLAGVGYVFSPLDEYAGVDFDKCRNPVTGAIDPEVRAMIGLLDSYSEVSPSGTGVKVFVKAKIPGTRNRTTRFEFYDSDRYFTTTGHRLPDTPPTIENRQPQLNQLYRRIFEGYDTDTARITAAIGDCTTEASALWQWAYPRLTPPMMRTANGDDSRYDGDASRADAGLCGALLALGLTRAEAAAAFRASPRGLNLEARKDPTRLDYLILHAVNAAASVVGEAKEL